MSDKQNWSFDIDIGEETQCYSISKLLHMADEAKVSQRYEDCYNYLRRASSTPAGKYKLAKFLLDFPGIGMLQEQRFQEAERLLIEIHHNSKKACLELASLYMDRLTRPVAALAYFLKARNLGAEIEPKILERCKGSMRKSDISKTEANIRDCYDLGLALYENGYGESASYASYFLQIVCDSGIRSDYVGTAALILAELYEDEKDFPAAAKFYNLASKLGNPPLLTKHG